MKVYNVGNDDVSFDNYNYEWVVYSFTSGNYEGYGTSIGFRDGKLYELDLGYDSLSNFDNNEYEIPIEFMKSDNSIFDYDEPIRKKVLELLNENI